MKFKLIYFKSLKRIYLLIVIVQYFSHIVDTTLSDYLFFKQNYINQVLNVKKIKQKAILTFEKRCQIDQIRVIVIALPFL